LCQGSCLIVPSTLRKFAIKSGWRHPNPIGDVHPPTFFWRSIKFEIGIQPICYLSQPHDLNARPQCLKFSGRSLQCSYRKISPPRTVLKVLQKLRLRYGRNLCGPIRDRIAVVLICKQGRFGDQIARIGDVQCEKPAIFQSSPKKNLAPPYKECHFNFIVTPKQRLTCFKCSNRCAFE